MLDGSQENNRCHKKRKPVYNHRLYQSFAMVIQRLLEQSGRFTESDRKHADRILRAFLSEDSEQLQLLKNEFKGYDYPSHPHLAKEDHSGALLLADLLVETLVIQPEEIPVFDQQQLQDCPEIPATLFSDFYRCFPCNQLDEKEAIHLFKPLCQWWNDHHLAANHQPAALVDMYYRDWETSEYYRIDAYDPAVLHNYWSGISASCAYYKGYVLVFMPYPPEGAVFHHTTDNHPYVDVIHPKMPATHFMGLFREFFCYESFAYGLSLSDRPLSSIESIMMNTKLSSYINEDENENKLINVHINKAIKTVKYYTLIDAYQLNELFLKKGEVLFNNQHGAYSEQLTLFAQYVYQQADAFTQDYMSVLIIEKIINYLEHEQHDKELRQFLNIVPLHPSYIEGSKALLLAIKNQHDNFLTESRQPLTRESSDVRVAKPATIYQRGYLLNMINIIIAQCLNDKSNTLYEKDYLCASLLPMVSNYLFHCQQNHRQEGRFLKLNDLLKEYNALATLSLTMDIIATVATSENELVRNSFSDQDQKQGFLYAGT